MPARVSSHCARQAGQATQTGAQRRSKGATRCPSAVRPADVPLKRRQQHICRVSTTQTLTAMTIPTTSTTAEEGTGLSSSKIIELCTEFNEARKSSNDWKRQQDATDAVRLTAGQWAASIVEQLRASWELDNNEQARADAIDNLAVVLWQAYSLDDQTFLKERVDLLRTLGTVMTAGEHIVLFERVPALVRLTPEELYDFATAYLAQGYRQRRDAKIDTAERLFMSAIQIADMSKGWWGWGLPAPVVREAYLARATCNILLNRIQLAERLLETSGQSMAKVQNAAFKSEADTAMYMIAERVMNEDVFALYREFKDYRADLEKWVAGRPFPLTYLGTGTPPKVPGWPDAGNSGALKTVDEALKSIDEVSNLAFGAVKNFFKF